jgi:exosortase A-associated hydrolase 1
MRLVHSAPCEGAWIVGALDSAAGDTGLLILSGGNEIAIGPQRAMARLARSIAERGWPVLRFDRRGVGDSDGENRGWRSSTPDIAAAMTLFADSPVRRIVAFGNCDAATALALHRLPIAARVLGNPWLDLAGADLPPPAAIRSHYRRRLFDPALWRALTTGRVDLAKAVRGLRSASRTGTSPSALAVEVATALRERPLPTHLVLSARDATGIAFGDAWRHPIFDEVRSATPVSTINTDSHGFTGPDDLVALRDILLAVIEDTSASSRT